MKINQMIELLTNALQLNTNPEVEIEEIQFLGECFSVKVKSNITGEQAWFRIRVEPVS